MAEGQAVPGSMTVLECSTVLSKIESESVLELSGGILLWQDVDRLLDCLDTQIVKSVRLQDVRFIQVQDLEDLVYALQNSAQFLEALSLIGIRLVAAGGVAALLTELVDHASSRSA